MPPLPTSPPTIIGNPDNSFWRFHPSTGFDLTHPPTPTSPLNPPAITLQTTTTPIKIDPSKTALVIIDMQNFFLSPLLSKPRDSPGQTALSNLVSHAIPACRTAGIRIIWLNWGLTEQEVREMPPACHRAFGFAAGVDKHGTPIPEDSPYRKHAGLGREMGIARDATTGEEVDAGRMLMRDQWNTALCPPLDRIYEEGTRLERRPDVWIHKNRMSGLWGPSTLLEEFLEREGIRTLLFAGVNTDQCVGGTFQDAWSKGYDTILVGDGAGTTSPDFAQKCLEWNAENTWGWLVSCQQIAEGVEAMK